MSHPPAQESSGLESTLDAICALGLHQELIEGWANEIKSYTRKARDIATNHIEIKSAVEKTERKLAKRLGRLRSKIEADCIAGVSTNSEDYFFSGAITPFEVLLEHLNIEPQALPPKLYFGSQAAQYALKHATTYSATVGPELVDYWLDACIEILRELNPIARDHSHHPGDPIEYWQGACTEWHTFLQGLVSRSRTAHELERLNIYFGMLSAIHSQVLKVQQAGKISSMYFFLWIPDKAWLKHHEKSRT